MARPSAASLCARRRRAVSSRGLPPGASTTQSCARGHATARDGPDSLVPAWPPTPHPTPYEIFDMHNGAPYTKRRFYQLVKLYHPDTHHCPGAPSSSPTSSAVSASSPPDLSHAARLERYRLVVAANNLLSDPSRRRLYDTHGIGWTDGHRAPSLREADRAWRHQPGNAARNATWEDWERWHEAREGRGREPKHMSNGVFAALVVAMCTVGAMAQANRAETSAAQVVGLTQRRDAAIGQEMRKNTMVSAGRSKDERVDSFLRDRENVAYESAPGRYDGPPQPPRAARHLRAKRGGSAPCGVVTGRADAVAAARRRAQATNEAVTAIIGPTAVGEQPHVAVARGAGAGLGQGGAACRRCVLVAGSPNRHVPTEAETGRQLAMEPSSNQTTSHGIPPAPNPPPLQHTSRQSAVMPPRLRLSPLTAPLLRRLYSSASSGEPLIRVTHLPAASSGHIRVLELNRPGARNAISKALLASLRAEVDDVQAQYGPDGEELPAAREGAGAAELGPTRALVIASAVDVCFCAGADLKERRGFTQEETADFLANLRGTFAALSDLPVPTISAISSLALGGGLELALSTHFRVLTSNATVGLPETRLGIIPGAGGTHRLPALVGLARARDLILTGRRVAGPEAYFLGIADRLVEVVPEDERAAADILQLARRSALSEAVRLAQEICEGGPVAIRAGLQAVAWARAEKEDEMYQRVVDTADRNEALKAFQEKRKPIFRGR
ncbi:Methylglutaconyl-CoA hydratase, mitochondrial [Tolypocladium capitatum]|uniref:Methylglutaconyl-CoA hydratase, mitochondrial n=1 Tax=Tolypocladium capitatum TaxID=45235 RepID=A0A2K3QBP0_9HYPO|nr:Methylglutaconyl-CoA hydratase, mitochondrial [Tolypocladium capitatum]